MGKQFILVVYDISNDRRRTKLHNALLDFGTPVQYSVFECIVEDASVVKLKKAVRKVIRPRLDHVRFYFLCEKCLEKVEASGGDVVKEPPDSWVV